MYLYFSELGHRFGTTLLLSPSPAFGDYIIHLTEVIPQITDALLLWVCDFIPVSNATKHLHLSPHFLSQQTYKLGNTITPLCAPEVR